MKVWWRAHEFDTEPQRAEVERETPKCVFIKERYFGKIVLRKHTKDDYYPTWSEARAYIVKRLTSKITSAQFNMDLRKGERIAALALKKPAGAE